MPISVRLSPDSMRELDSLVVRGNYKDRSEAIRSAISLLQEALDDDDQKRVTLTLTKADYDRLRRAKVFP